MSCQVTACFESSNLPQTTYSFVRPRKGTKPSHVTEHESSDDALRREEYQMKTSPLPLSLPPRTRTNTPSPALESLTVRRLSLANPFLSSSLGTPNNSSDHHPPSLCPCPSSLLLCRRLRPSSLPSSSPRTTQREHLSVEISCRARTSCQRCRTGRGRGGVITRRGG